MWQIKAGIQQRLTVISGPASEPVQVIAALPLPVGTYPRARRDRCFPLLSASPHDITHGGVIEGARGVIPADTGVIDEYQHRLWAEQHGVEIITPPRARMEPAPPPAVLKTCRRWRKVVETVGSHLTARCGVTRIGVHDLWITSIA